MMRFADGLWMVLLLPLVQSGQERDTPTPPGRCGEVLAFVADYVERNYAGFQAKVPEAGRPRYEEHKTELRARVGGVSTEAECHGLLLEYTGFFQDPHLSVSHRTESTDAPASDDAIRARFADRPVRLVSEEGVRDYLDGAPDELRSIEGIWEIVDTDYRVAILPDGAAEGRYEAVILSADSVWWVPGQIKATFERTAAGRYQADFYMRDHSLREEEARLRQGVLVFSGVSSWARVYPENISGYDPVRYRETESNREFAVRTLDANTLLLTLPDFNPLLQAQIDSMITANWGRLSNARNLIIDVRGNPGGSNASYSSVQPLLYTGPVVTPGMSHRATDDNIRLLEAFLEAGGITQDLEGQVREIITRMREHRGAFVPAADDTLTLDAVLPTPQRVAVLADRWCASSCESFVWSALQSEKTTVFGENTGGFLDYGDALPVETPSPAFWLHSPTARSNRVPQGTLLDNVGIEPDVRVPEEVLFWVDWVREHLR